MKQSESELIRSIEERGFQRARERFAKGRSNLDKRIVKVLDEMATIRAKLAELDGAELVAEKPQPKKRKPVEASEMDLKLVQDAFKGLPDHKIVLLPKNIGNLFNPPIGLKRLSAGCRGLVDRGVLEAVGRKGYRLITGKEDGLDEQRS